MYINISEKGSTLGKYEFDEKELQSANPVGKDILIDSMCLALLCRNSDEDRLSSRCFFANFAIVVHISLQ